MLVDRPIENTAMNILAKRTDALLALSVTFATLPKVRSMNTAEIVKQVAAVCAEVKALNDQVDLWEVPCEVPEKVAALMEVAKKVSKHEVELQRLERGFERLQKGGKKASAKTKKKWRDARKKMEGYFHLADQNLPDSVGRRVAEVVQSKVCDPVQIDISVTLTANEFTTYSKDYLEKPFTVTCPPAEGAATTKWHLACQDQFAKNQASVLEKAVALHRGMVEASLRHAQSAVADLTEVKFPDADDSTDFVSTGVAKLAVGVISNEYFDLDYKAWAWRGVRMVMTVVQGTVCCVFISPCQFASSPDVNTWLQSSDAKKKLLNNDCFIVTAGSSIYVPFGHVAIPIALSDDSPKIIEAQKGSKKRKAAPPAEKGHAVVGIKLLMSVEKDRSHSDKLRSTVISQWSQAGTGVPYSFRNDNNTAAWLDGIKPTGAAGD